jgi:hypothetical protein
MKIILSSFAVLVLLFSSCKKQDVLSSAPIHPENTLVVSFNVEEQVNVSNYQIQLSENGTDFVYAAGIILADDLATSKYSINIDVTKYQKAIYVRIKSTDVDGAVDYSKVVTARSN